MIFVIVGNEDTSYQLLDIVEFYTRARGARYRGALHREYYETVQYGKRTHITPSGSLEQPHTPVKIAVVSAAYYV